MKIWLITDTHFGHSKMVEYCGRPENFEDKIKKNLIEVICSDDLLIHLGDVCIGNDKENNNWFGKTLNCKKVLVKGNHDNKTNAWYLNNGWDFVCKTFKDKFFGKIILFSHVPQSNNGNYDINIHGHFHNALPRLLRGEWKVDGEKERNEQDLLNYQGGLDHILLALEHTNYKPITLRGLIN